MINECFCLLRLKDFPQFWRELRHSCCASAAPPQSSLCPALRAEDGVSVLAVSGGDGIRVHPWV